MSYKQMNTNIRIALRLSSFLVSVVSVAIGVGAVSGKAAQNVSGTGTRQAQQFNPSALPQTNLITEGVTFAPVMTFEKEQERRYETQSSMVLYYQEPNNKQVTSTPSTLMNVVLYYKVQDTMPDGSAQVSVSSEGGSMRDAGNTFQKLEKEPATAARVLNLDRQSRIVAFNDPSERLTSGGLDALLNQLNLLIPLHILPLPNKTIHVGENWTALYATPGNPGSGDKSKKENRKGVTERKDSPEEAPEDLQEETSGQDKQDKKEARRTIKATFTLLGIEKIGGVDTIKIKQVLAIPSVTYTDSRGKPTEARNAKGRMNAMLIFTQMVNVLPQNGLMVRSVGNLAGKVSFEGALAGKVFGNAITLSGKMVVVRLEDEPPAQPSK